MGQPVLQTPRLTLRPFALSDVEDIVRMAGDALIADTTANISHPYEPIHAESWIGTHAEKFEAGRQMNAAITDRGDGTLYGAVGLEIDPAHSRAELGYWTGVPYWGRGYATEASAALLTWAFADRGLARVFARHYARNPASGRIMQKLGMRHEGTMRQHSRHGDTWDDVEIYGTLAAEFSPPPAPGPRA